MTVQDRARRYIAPIHAISGSGGHNSCLTVAYALKVGFNFTDDQALPLFRDWNATNTGGEPFSESQLHHKLNSVDATGSSKPPGYLLGEGEASTIDQPSRILPSPKPKPKWPDLNETKVIDLIRTNPVTVAELNSISPIPPAAVNEPYALLEMLFCQGKEKNPWLCLGWNYWEANTRQRSDWQGQLHEILPQFIVPNPMKGESGKTKDGKDSARAKDNVLSRRFVVIECDFCESKHPEIFEQIEKAGITVHDLCATILMQLCKLAPLIMAVNSGIGVGKSTHGWFPANVPKKVQYAFFREACTLGADPAMAQPHQWTRFPGGRRGEDGPVQTVEYFNPDPKLLSF